MYHQGLRKCKLPIYHLRREREREQPVWSKAKPARSKLVNGLREGGEVLTRRIPTGTVKFFCASFEYTNC